MSASSPDPRFYKDGAGLHPRLRLFFHAPKFYLWLKCPRWLRMVMIRRWDRQRAALAREDRHE